MILNYYFFIFLKRGFKFISGTRRACKRRAGVREYLRRMLRGCGKRVWKVLRCDSRLFPASYEGGGGQCTDPGMPSWLTHQHHPAPPPPCFDSCFSPTLSHSQHCSIVNKALPLPFPSSAPPCSGPAHAQAGRLWSPPHFLLPAHPPPLSPEKPSPCQLCHSLNGLGPPPLLPPSPRQ